MSAARRLFFLLSLLFVGAASAQQSDVTFFVIGKHGNFDQSTLGQHTSVDFSFFSEIFLTTDGSASDATLQFPTGEVVPFKDMRDVDGGARDNIFLLAGEERPSSYAALLKSYPDGDYLVSFKTPSGSVQKSVLNFADRPLPKPPLISVRQGDQENCHHLAPGVDAQVTWSPFYGGRADPNGILDDLIFAILTDANGNRVAHSGRPFEGRPFLNYASESFVIPGDALKPDQTFTLSVEHALLDDTTRFDGVPAFTTRAVTTKLAIDTGSSAPEPCTPMPTIPSLTSQTTMFYYKELSAADHFYGEILGLEKTLDWDWVKFYKTGPASTVGLVVEGDGGWHKVQATNAVMLSLVTDEVDAWYQQVKAKKGAVFLKDIADGGPIRSFLLEDPGGYTVEFFQWLELPE